MNLNQVTIPSLDVEKSVAFYKLLGLQLIVDATPKYVRFECPDGDTTFSVHKVEKINKNKGVTIYFEDKNLDEWVTELQKKSVVFNQLPEDKSWLWREAHLQDPDGNHIILYNAGKTGKTRLGGLNKKL